MKLKLLTSIATLILVFGFSPSVLASMPPVYPTYGYNAESNLCQIKQSSADATVQENLSGEYWSLRECRVENPKVFLNTGSGIAIWLIIFSSAFVSHFYIYPRFQKKSAVEKHVSFLSDLMGMGLIVFFIVLLQHYFSLPYAYYDYGSDIDRIIYSNFIHPGIPSFYALAYFLSIGIRALILFTRRGK